MKTWQILASAVVGLSLIASANVPRTPTTPVVAPAPATAPQTFNPSLPADADRADATRAVLDEQRTAMVAEARARVQIVEAERTPRTAP